MKLYGCIGVVPVIQSIYFPITKRVFHNGFPGSASVLNKGTQIIVILRIENSTKYFTVRLDRHDVCS